LILIERWRNVFTPEIHTFSLDFVLRFLVVQNISRYYFYIAFTTSMVYFGFCSAEETRQVPYTILFYFKTSGVRSFESLFNVTVIGVCERVSVSEEHEISD
jgi:hypothetical protein